MSANDGALEVLDGMLEDCDEHTSPYYRAAITVARRRIAALAAVDALETSPRDHSLVVEFVVPHYFGSLLMDQYPDEHGGLGGVVYFRNEEDVVEQAIGDITMRPNAHGDWLIEVRNGDDNHVVIGTDIENVERIVIL